MIETVGNESFVAVLIIALGLIPGYWLYRDAGRKGRNQRLWAIAYAIALIAPWRLLFIPIVVVAWLLVRNGVFIRRKS